MRTLQDVSPASWPPLSDVMAGAFLERLARCFLRPWSPLDSRYTFIGFIGYDVGYVLIWIRMITKCLSSTFTPQRRSSVPPRPSSFVVEAFFSFEDFRPSRQAEIKCQACCTSTSGSFMQNITVCSY